MQNPVMDQRLFRQNGRRSHCRCAIDMGPLLPAKKSCCNMSIEKRAADMRLQSHGIPRAERSCRRKIGYIGYAQTCADSDLRQRIPAQSVSAIAAHYPKQYAASADFRYHQSFLLVRGAGHRSGSAELIISCCATPLPSCGAKPLISACWPGRISQLLLVYALGAVCGV